MFVYMELHCLTDKKNSNIPMNMFRIIDNASENAKDR